MDTLNTLKLYKDRTYIRTWAMEAYVNTQATLMHENAGLYMGLHTHTVRSVV